MILPVIEARTSDSAAIVSETLQEKWLQTDPGSQSVVTVGAIPELAILLIVTLFSLESSFAYCNVECSPERRNSHYNKQNYFLAKTHYNKQHYYQPRRSRSLELEWS